MIIYKIKRSCYRLYRKLKNYYLTHPVRFDTKIFFKCLELINIYLSPNKTNKILDNIWKKKYFLKYGTNSLYYVKCKNKIAEESDDQKYPHGARFNSSINRNFNRKLYSYFNYKKDLRVLDLGCAGGGFVRSILEDGFIAIGLEGSDLPKKFKLQEWNTCPNHLFTCDISSFFLVKNKRCKEVVQKFHCITMWEVLEHIPTDKLHSLFKNIIKHLTSEGIFVASIDSAPDGNPIIGATYHKTVKKKKWWLKQFDLAGFSLVENHNFNAEDYVRGHGLDLLNWHPADGEGFHVVLKKK
jgi:hypothetical protein